MRFLLANVSLLSVADHILPILASTQSSSIAEVPQISQHQPYLARKADVRLNHDLYYHRRMASLSPTAQPTVSSNPSMTSGAGVSPNSTTTSSPDPTPTPDAACMNALIAMNGQASNPSGMAVCYNVLSYDNITGTFQANLKLYRVSDGSGDWFMVRQQGMSIGVMYPNATAAYTNKNIMFKRSNWLLHRLQAPSTRREGKLMGRASSPEMISDLIFVGEVNNSTMGQPYNESTMKEAVMPQVILSGATQNGTQLSTTLSTKDASFLHGAFSNDQTVTAPSATPFVLPGTTLGIFPVGLIITGAWALLLILAVGLGTLGRNEHRKSYRRRIDNQVGSSEWK